MIFLMWKHWIYISFVWQFFLFLARYSDLINSNICITKTYWMKSNFPSKCVFMSDEEKKQTIARFMWKNCQILPHFSCITLNKDHNKFSNANRFRFHLFLNNIHSKSHLSATAAAEDRPPPEACMSWCLRRNWEVRNEIQGLK